MNTISILTLVFSSVILTACASVGLAEKSTDQDQIENKTLGLPAQDLVEGECGAFLWAETKPRQFVYFQKQDQPVAQFYSDGQSKPITTTEITSYLADTGKLDLNYKSTDGSDVKVKGTFVDEIEGGFRISPATISVQSTDGWQQIIPVSGVFICR